MTDTPFPAEARERVRRLLEATEHRAPSWCLTAWDSKGWAIVDRTTLSTAFTAMNDVCEAAERFIAKWDRVMACEDAATNVTFLDAERLEVAETLRAALARLKE